VSPLAARTKPPREEKIMTTFTSIRGRAVSRFLRHYLEMIIAMIVGMIVLGIAETMLFNQFGWAGALAQPEAAALIMATNMIVPMAAWMRFRRHRWAAIAEMAVAMYLPFVVLFGPLWLGLLSDTGLMVLGHVLMLFAMGAVMLRRRDDYSGHHREAVRS
jgi:putative flippase GtrA